MPGVVSLFPSGNGQDFAPDYTLHSRDIENTFYYMQDAFVEDLLPNGGPSVGGTKITIRGYGFQPLKFDNGTLDYSTMFIKFMN